MPTSVHFNAMAHELHLDAYEQLLLCRNVPVRWEDRFPHGHYVYDLDDRWFNFDRRSRLASQHIFEQNRLVRVSVRGSEIFQPSFYVPILTDDDVEIGRYMTGRPSCVAASMYIGVTTFPPCRDQGQACLISSQMLRSFLSKLGALRAARLPRDILVQPDLLNNVYQPHPVQYDIVVDVHLHPSPNFQATCASELLAAMTELRGDGVHVWTNSTSPSVPIQVLEQALQPGDRDLGTWLEGAIEQHRSWINSSARIATQCAHEALAPEHPLAYTSPAIANVLHSLFQVVFRSSWTLLDVSPRIMLARCVVAATFNAMAIARGRGSGQDGWRNVLKGRCERPLCLCAIMTYVKGYELGGSDDEQLPALPSEWPILQGMDLSSWLAMCHSAALVHALPEDVVSVEDVDQLRACIRELRALRHSYRRAGLACDRNLLYDIAVLDMLIKEIETWRAAHQEEDLGEFRPTPRGGEEADFVDTIDILWHRLSLSCQVEGFPLRVMYVEDTGAQIRVASEDGSEAVYDKDFI